jgi:hypothetical protein
MNHHESMTLVNVLLGHIGLHPNPNVGQGELQIRALRLLVFVGHRQMTILYLFKNMQTMTTFLSAVWIPHNMKVDFSVAIPIEANRDDGWHHGKSQISLVARVVGFLVCLEFHQLTWDCKCMRLVSGGSRLGISRMSRRSLSWNQIPHMCKKKRQKGPPRHLQTI